MILRIDVACHVRCRTLSSASATAGEKRSAVWTFDASLPFVVVVAAIHEADDTRVNRWCSALCFISSPHAL